MISEEPGCVVDTAASGEVKAACFSGMQSRNVSRDNVNGSGACRHSCAHHSEVMDPCLWSRLPEHLLGYVLARLSMPQIFCIEWLSKVWLATSRTPGFKRICGEAHPKTFGVLGFHRSNGANLLTNEWRTLPPIDIKQPVMVQLVADVETGGYRVIVVCRHGGIRLPRLVESIERSAESSISETAEVYDSKTGLWSTMNSGYVYGRDRTEYSLTKVFNCKSKKPLRLSSRLCLKGQLLIDATVVKNHVIALHSDLSEPDRDSVFEVSELADEADDPGVLRISNRYKSPLGSESNGYSVVLFGSDGFILLVADNGEENFGEYHHQLVHLYDISRQEWHKLPVLNDIYIVENTANHFMCELRWDAFP